MNTPPTVRMLRLLLIEDDPLHSRLVREAFDQAGPGHDLIVCADAATALARLRLDRSHGRPLPDVILIELNLPGMRGGEFLAELRADPHLGHLPVLVLSTSDSPREIRLAYELGSNAYLVAPSSFAGLCDLARAVDGFWTRVSTCGQPRPVGGRRIDG